MTAVYLVHPAASRHLLRQRLTVLIDRLIGALDAIDGDPDFEEGADDEPTLAFQEARPGDSQDAVIRWSPTGGEQFTDLEEVCEDEGAFDGDNDTSDYEPSLCGITCCVQQAQIDG